MYASAPDDFACCKLLSSSSIVKIINFVFRCLLLTSEIKSDPKPSPRFKSTIQKSGDTELRRARPSDFDAAWPIIEYSDLGSASTIPALINA